MVAAIAAKKGPSQIKKMTKEKKIQVTKKMVANAKKLPKRGKSTKDLERPRTKVKNQAGPKMKGPYMESNAQERSNLLNDNPIASRASGGSWMSKHIHRM